MRKSLRAVSLAALVAAGVGLPGLTASAAPGPPPQRTITVATHDLEPFVMTRGNIKSGFTIDIVDQIAKHGGWNVEYVDVPDVGSQLRSVTENRTDAAAGAISITADRAERFDFSQPILNAGLQIMVPASHAASSSPGLQDFLRLLFSRTMLVWLFAALVLTIVPAHIIWLIERRHSDAMVSRSYFPGIFQSFAWGLGMLAAAADDSPRHWGTRALAVLWAFVSIIFVAYYTATLTANLTVAKFDARISSPSDLVGREVCTVENTTSAAFLNEQGIGFTGVPTIDACYSGLKDDIYEAVVFDAPVLQFYVANEGAGSAALVGTVFQGEDYGIAFRNGSELRKQADSALLLMREDGDYDLIKQKWFGDAG